MPDSREEPTLVEDFLLGVIDYFLQREPTNTGDQMLEYAINLVLAVGEEAQKPVEKARGPLLFQQMAARAAMSGATALVEEVLRGETKSFDDNPIRAVAHLIHASREGISEQEGEDHLVAGMVLLAKEIAYRAENLARPGTY